MQATNVFVSEFSSILWPLLCILDLCEMRMNGRTTVRSIAFASLWHHIQLYRFQFCEGHSAEVERKMQMIMTNKKLQPHYQNVRSVCRQSTLSTRHTFSVTEIHFNCFPPNFSGCLIFRWHISTQHFQFKTMYSCTLRC